MKISRWNTRNVVYAGPLLVSVIGRVIDSMILVFLSLLGAKAQKTQGDFTGNATSAPTVSQMAETSIMRPLTKIYGGE
jgi:hypothetical protein